MEKEIISQYIMNLLNTSPEIIKNKIQLNNQEFNKKTKFYDIKSYIDEFLNQETDNRFFIMPGLRGVGKTTIIFQLYNYLLNEKKIAKNRLLYLNLDRIKDFSNFNIKDFIDYFIEDVHNAYPLIKEPVFIFVDESQYSDNWSLVGKIIFDEQKNVFMIFTGFNALNLEYNNDSARRSLKKEIYPLNFEEYLYLKYNLKINRNNDLEDMIFTGEVKNSVKIEKKINNEIFLNLNKNKLKEWENYLQFGGFPFSLNRSNTDSIQLTLAMKDRVIEKDMDIFTSFTSPTRLASYKLINLLATLKPSEISLSKLSNILNISKETVNSILSAFEMTQLLFHIEPYGSPAKRVRKAWKYYFLSSQIKASIYLNSGQATRHPKEYMSTLAENLVASTLFKIKRSKDIGIFYDPEKGGVDFLINTIIGDIIPIEVGIGKKDKKQIKTAIKRYDSDYGIIVSNRTSEIQKEDNIISIPLTTFSFI
jgi:predicted AAA+ superfamily ATPase